MATDWLKGLTVSEIETELIQRASFLHSRGKISVPVFDQYDEPLVDGCLTCNTQSCRLVRDLTALLRMT